jgi:hypothetical protein
MFSKIIAILALLDNRAQRRLRWDLEQSKRGEGDWRYCNCKLCREVREGRVWVRWPRPIAPVSEDPRVAEYRGFLDELDRTGSE